MKKIGVIGAGVMGSGVAQLFAQNGFSTFLLDINQQALANAKKTITNNIRFNSLYDPDGKELIFDNIIKNIVFTDDYDVLRNCDFIVENTSERLETKEKVYLTLNDICSPQSIYLVNTSCISITKIASLTNKPHLVIGAHFMNPAPYKKTVELIKGELTSKETLEKVSRLLRQIGMESIVVNDYPGFVSNRISHLYINEAAFVVQDQVASPEDVDMIFKKCYDHKMGPLETADLIGLDTVVDSLEVLYCSFQDTKYRCCPLLKKMVNAGLLGRKSGQGFYNYK